MSNAPTLTDAQLDARIRRLDLELAPHRTWGECPMTGAEDCCDTLVIELRLLREIRELRSALNEERGGRERLEANLRPEADSPLAKQVAEFEGYLREDGAYPLVVFGGTRDDNALRRIWRGNIPVDCTPEQRLVDRVRLAVSEQVYSMIHEPLGGPCCPEEIQLDKLCDAVVLATVKALSAPHPRASLTGEPPALESPSEEYLPISGDAFDAACDLVERLKFYPRPEWGRGKRGQITLDWYAGDWSLTVEVLSSEKAIYAMTEGDDGAGVSGGGAFETAVANIGGCLSRMPFVRSVDLPSPPEGEATLATENRNSSGAPSGEDTMRMVDVLHILTLAIAHAEEYSGVNSRGKINSAAWQALFDRVTPETIAALFSRVDALESERVGLLEDRERIEWLEQNSAQVHVFDPPSDAWVWEVAATDENGQTIEPIGCDSDLRKAIDAARASLPEDSTNG